MCSISNQINTNIKKIEAKKKKFFLPWMLRLCKSLGKINFLEEQNQCTWGWALTENQKHPISDSQNDLLLIEKA